MKTRLLAIVTCFAISACSGGGSDVDSNAIDDSESPSMVEPVVQATDPVVESPADPVTDDSELESDPYPGYFVVELSIFNATDCDLTTPRFDISVGAEVEWPLCKLFYRRVIGDNVVGYYEMSFAFDKSIALIPLEHMGDIFTIKEDVIGVLLRSDSLESKENLCMVGDMYELDSNINYFGYIPEQSCSESQVIIMAMAM